jgi:autotransporter-associated beta strand protein
VRAFSDKKGSQYIFFVPASLYLPQIKQLTIKWPKNRLLSKKSFFDVLDLDKPISLLATGSSFMKTLRRYRQFLGWFMTCIMAISLPSQSMQAAAGTWVPTVSGTYYWLNNNYGDANTPLIPPWGVTGAGTDASPFVLDPIPNASTDTANLLNNISGNQSIILDAPITLGSLNIGDLDSTHAFSLRAGNGGSLIFNNAGIAASLTKTGSITDSIFSNILLNDALNVSVGTGGQLDLEGVVSGANTLTKLGTGNLRLSGANTYSAGTLIGDAASPVGNILLGSSSVGGLSGSAITSGPLGTGTVTLTAASAPVIQSDSTASRTLANAVTANSDFTLGATGTGSVVLGGTLNLGAGAPRVITSVGNNFITGVVSNGGLSTSGAGVLHLRGANTFSGATTIGTGSTVVAGANAALGTAAVSIGGATIASDAARTLGNALTLTGNLSLGADPRVAGNYDGQTTLGGAVNLGGATRTLTTITSGAPTLVSGNADTISGAISNGGIVKAGDGRLVLSGTNTTITGIQIDAGVLQFNSDVSFGTNPASVAAGADYLTLNGGVLAFNNGSQVNAPNNIGVNVAADSTVDVMNGNLVMFNNTLATMKGSGDLNKVGTGGYILVGGGTSTWNGDLNIVQGFVMAGTTGVASNGAPLAAVNSVAVQSGAQLRISNGTSALGNNADRINNAAAITMNGGFAELANSAGAGINYSETFGTTTANRGANGFISYQSASGTTAGMTIANLVRSAGATVNFTSNTALVAGTAGLGQTAQSTITLTQINGVAPAVGFIGGWATVGSGAATTYATSTSATEWAKYDATLGVQPFLPADYTGVIGTGNHVKYTPASGTVSVGGGLVNTLNLNSTGAALFNIGTGNTLRVESGGLIMNAVNSSGATNANAASGATVLPFASTANFAVGMGVAGTGVPAGAIITGITATSITLSAPISAAINSGASITFNNAIHGGSLTAGASVDAASDLIFHQSTANNFFVNSNITNNGTGAVSLVKSGTGPVILTGTNTFTGGVNLNQGTLRFAPNPTGVGTSLALPSSNAFNVVNGSLTSSTNRALVIPNNITIHDSLTLGDAVGVARTFLTGNITLSAPSGGIASIIAHTNTAATITGNISGGSLRIGQVAATGRVQLAGTNTFASTDHIRVDSGILTVGSAGALGSAKIVLNGGGIETGLGYSGAISNDILFTANSSFGSALYSNPTILSGSIDLGGAVRTVTANSNGYHEISGVITNGGILTSGNGVFTISGTSNNYLGGTSVGDGILWLKGNATAGANIPGNNVTVNAGTNSDIGIRLDGPQNIGSNQILTINPASGNGANAISLGSGFASGTNLNPSIAFVNSVTGTGTGIMNTRLVDNATGKFLISLDGITLNQDVLATTLTAAPNSRVWLGASQAGAVINVPISTGLGGHYRLGGGLDSSMTTTNQAGVLSVNANVLSGSGTLFIGAEDNTALSNIGGSSVVWMKGAQPGFSGGVTIGSGGTLNVAQGTYLGTGNTITLRAGTLRILNESGLAGFESSQINNSFSGKNIVVGVGGGTIRHDNGTGNFSNQVAQLGTLTLDASDATAGNRTLTIADAGVNNGELIFTNFTINNGATNRGIINVGANFARISGSITTGAAGLEKAGAGTLILDTPSATTLGGPLTMTAGTLTLTNPNNFTAPSTVFAGSSTVVARSDSGVYGLNLGAMALSGGNATFHFGNLTTAGATSSTITLAGNLTPSVAARTVTVRALDNSTVNATGNWTVGSAGFLTTTISVTAGRLNIQNPIGQGASGGILLSTGGRGVLDLQAANTFSGGLQGATGTVLLSNDGAAGSGTISFNGGSGSILTVGTRTIANQLSYGTGAINTDVLGSLSGSATYQGALNIAAVTGLSVTPFVANYDAAGVTTFSGIISQGNAFTAQGIVTKIGDGTVKFSNANTYTSGTQINRGTFEGVAQAAGSPFGNGAFILGGGTLKLTGIGQTTSTVSTGALTVGGNNYGGKLVINDLATADGFTTNFTVGSLALRSGRGSLVIVPQNGNLNTEEILTFGTTVPNNSRGILPAYMATQVSAANADGNFVAISGSNVIAKTYTAGTDQGDLSALPTTGTLVFDNNVAATLVASKSVFSLRTDSSLNLGGFTLNIGDQSLAANNTVTNAAAASGATTLSFASTAGFTPGMVVTGAGIANNTYISAVTATTITLNTATSAAISSGATINYSSPTSGLILNNGASISAGTIRTGSSELVTYVEGGQTSTISASIASLDALSANAIRTNTGLTKTGEGTLVLSGSNRYTGLTTVASGTLEAGAANVLGQFSLSNKVESSGLQIGAGATFNMSGAGFNQTIGSLAGQGVINMGANTLMLGNDNATTTFSGQIIATAGATLLKTGTGTLTLSNLLTGSNANSSISNIYVDQGTLVTHISDGAPYSLPNGDTFALQSTNAIPAGSTFTLRGGALQLAINHADVGQTTTPVTIRTGYNLVNELSSTFGAVSGLLGTNDNKQVSINDLTLNRYTFTTSSANTNIFQVDGDVILTENANISAGAYFNINGDITDGGNFYTLNKTGGQAIYVNSNTTFSGGTIINAGGAGIRFGAAGQLPNSFEDSLNTGSFAYNSTAKLGTGNIWLQPSTNSVSNIRLAETNLNSGQLLIARSAALDGNQALVEMLHDAPISSYNLRSTSSGALGLLVGPATNSTNVGRWTNAIDQQRIGSGNWGVSAVNDVVFDSTALSPGIASTYRFYGANTGAFIINKANTLTGSNNVAIGLSSKRFGTLAATQSIGTLNIQADQNYTGSTTIFRGAGANTNLRQAPANTLRVYGDLSTSGIENYGRLELIGAGTLTNAAGVNVVPLSMRPGSYLSFDYDAGFSPLASNAGNYLVDVSATSGINATYTTNKWQDDAVLTLPGSTLNIGNFNSRDTTEVIGGLAVTGLSDILLTPRTAGAVVLEMGSAISFGSIGDSLRLTGTLLGTAAATAGGASQTRVLFSNPAHAPASIGTLTNGVPLLSPRFFSGTGNTFLTYSNPLGFIPALPNLTSSTATMATSVATDFVDQTVVTTSVPVTQNLFALRLTAGLASTAAYTINIGGGGLIFNNGTTAANYNGLLSTTATSAAPGNFVFPSDGYIWTTGTGQNFVRNNITTTGALVINGDSQFVLAGSNSISGDIIRNGGTLNIFQTNNDQATTPTFWNNTTYSATVGPAGGAGSNIILMGANANNTTNILPRLELRTTGTATITNRNLVIGDATNALPYAEISVDRTGGTATGSAITIGGNLVINGSNGSEGTLLNVSGANTFTLTIAGTTSLGPKSVNFANSTGMTLTGAVSGASNLIKSNSSTLTLGSAANSYTGGTTLDAGTLFLSGAGSATATYLGTGNLEINGGSLTLNQTTNTALLNMATAVGNNLIIRGNSGINVQGVARTITLGNVASIFQTQGSPLVTFNQTNNNNANFQWNGGLAINDNPNFFVNNDSGNSIRSGLAFGSSNAANTFSGDGTIHKTGFGTMIFNRGTAANNFTGNINVFMGGLKANTATDTYVTGTGKISVSPGAFIGAFNNTTFTASQVSNFHSNSTALAGLVLLAGATNAPSTFLNASAITSGNADGSVPAAGAGSNGGALVLEGTYAGAALNMGTLFGGNWFLGGSVGINGTYNLATLTAGAADTVRFGGSNTGVYRLGANDGQLTIGSTANLLTGANAAVLIGKPYAENGRGSVLLSGLNNYAGNTVVSIGRDRNTTFSAAALLVQAGGNLATSALGTSTVDVYGRINFQGATGGNTNVGGTANDNTIVLHPGSHLVFENNAGTSTLSMANGGRWADSAGIALNGTELRINGGDGVVASATNAGREVVGAVTFERGNLIRVVRTNAGSSALDMASLTRTNFGTIAIEHNTSSGIGSTAVDAATSENLRITGVGAVGVAGNGNWGAATGTGLYSLTNDANMLNPYFVSRSARQFLKYDATNGVQIITQGTTPANYATGTGNIGVGVTYGTIASLANNGTEIIEVNNGTATLTSNLDILALRLGGATSGSAAINQDGANAFNTITIRSGGIISGAQNNGNTIRANVIFGTAAAPAEALIFNDQSTLDLDGQITATDVTKFGFGTLRVNQDQRTFTGDWNVNQGTLEFNTPYGAGVGGNNPIFIHATGSSNSDNASNTALQFATQNSSNQLSGDASLGTFYHGLATVMNAGTVQFFAPTDRSITVQNFSLDTSGATKHQHPGLFNVLVNNSRTNTFFGNVTLNDDFIFRVDAVAATFGTTGNQTAGSTVGATFNNLNNQGLYDITKLGDGVMYLGNISSSFTGARTFTVNEGAVRVNHATGSLGAAAATFIVDNGGALDIAVAGFAPVATLVQNAGSIERWSVNGARAASTFTLPTGVHLQINQSQTGTQTINLNGGSIMGYLASDLEEVATIRTLGAGITVNLQANSSLGQPYPYIGVAQYDMGRQNGYVNDPFNPRLSGAVLDIKGSITGAFDLDKIGGDIIQLSSTGNTYNNTNIKNGVLMMGATNALPATKTLTTSANGVLDINGFTTTTGTIAGTMGTITSGATTPTNLNVGDATNFSYSGVVSQGVRLVKQGAGDFTLGSAPQVATVTQGTNVATVTSTAGWYVGMPVIGTGIPSGTTIASINSATSVNLSNVATSAGTNIVPANTNWGGTEIVAGKIIVRDDANLGLVPANATNGAANLTFNGGTLRSSDNVSLAATRGVVVTSSGGTLETDATFTTNVGGTVALGGNFATTSGGNANFNGVVSGNGQFTHSGIGTATFSAVNTHTGKVEVATGTVALGTAGEIGDSSWLEIKTGAVFNTSGHAGSTASVDGVVSGSGSITGSLVVTSNTGSVNSVGVLRPGSATSNMVANAGDLNGTLTINGNLALAGSSTATTRAVLNVTTPTTNDYVNIGNAIATNTLLSYLNSQESTWNSASIGDHDYVNVVGNLDLRKNGQIQVTGWNPAYGDVLDLLDWTTVSINDFRHGAADAANARQGGLIDDLDLPGLGSSGLSYDLTLFNTSGIIVVVPEPSRALLLFFGLFALALRRRRGAAI